MKVKDAFGSEVDLHVGVNYFKSTEELQNESDSLAGDVRD